MTSVLHAQCLGSPFATYGAHVRRRKTSHFQQRQSQSRPFREGAAVVKTALASVASAYLAGVTCPKDDVREEGSMMDPTKWHGLARPRRVHSPPKENYTSSRSWRTPRCGPPEGKRVNRAPGDGDTKSPAGERACTSETSSNMTVNRHENSALSTTRKRRRGSTGDKNEGSGDEDAWNRQKQPRQLSPRSPTSNEPEFACPFKKHTPSKYVGCGRKSWPNTARIKQHLYRVHRQPIHCSRCYIIFDSDEDLRDHVRTASGCEVVLQPPHIEGINHIQERRLKSRRGLHGKSEKEKWRDMYLCLFPDADVIPSPYVDFIPGEYESFVERELPRVLEDAIGQELDGRFDELQSYLQVSIPGIIDRVMQGLRSSQKHPNTPNVAAGQPPSETLSIDEHMNNHAETSGITRSALIDTRNLKLPKSPWIQDPDTGFTAPGIQVDGLGTTGLADSAQEHSNLVFYDPFYDSFPYDNADFVPSSPHYLAPFEEIVLDHSNLED